MKLERPNLGGLELAPRARSKGAQGERSVPAAMQAEDRVPDGLEHPLHLVLAALVHRELDERRAEQAGTRGRGRAVVELDTAGQPAQRLLRRLALDLGLVDLVDLVARVCEPVGELPPMSRRAELNGCPWHDVKSMLRDVGLRPTRQRMSLGWILFAKGDRHLTAEMLYEEATKAKVPVSLATVYNTLHQFTEVGLLRQVAVDGSKTYFDTNTTTHHHFFVEG